MRLGGVNLRLDGDAVAELFGGFFRQLVGGTSRSFILVDSLGKSPLLLIFILNLAHNEKILAHIFKAPRFYYKLRIINIMSN